MAENSFTRLVGVLISPSKTFQAIAVRPTWLAPILVLVVLGTLVVLIAAPKVDWKATIQAKQVRTGLEISPERAELAIELMERLSLVRRKEASQ